MTALDLPPPLWAPTNAAIIRPAEHALLRPGAFRPCSRAERRAIVADLVRTRRLTPGEEERALLFVPVVKWISMSVSLLTFSAVSSGTANNVLAPDAGAGASAGDLCVAFVQTSGDVYGGLPSGWTELYHKSGASSRDIVGYYKVLEAGDLGANITPTGFSGDFLDSVCLAFTPDVAISTVTPSAWSYALTDGNPASQSVTASGGTVPLIVFGMSCTPGSTAAFSTASPAFDGTQPNSDSDMLAGYKIYNSSAADHTIDQNDQGGGNGLASGYLAVT